MIGSSLYYIGDSYCELEYGVCYIANRIIGNPPQMYDLYNTNANSELIHNKRGLYQANQFITKEEYLKMLNREHGIDKIIK